MARKQARKAKKEDYLDATPERLAKGDRCDIVNAAEIDSSEQNINQVRRFRTSRLDALHGNGKISYRAKLAGQWLEGICERATIKQKLNANWNGNGGGNVFFAFLPVSDSQEKAQALRKWALSTMPENMRGYMLRLCTHNDLPSRHDRSGARTVVEICRALEALADSLHMPG